jgi:hypothetical protein
MKNYFDKKRSLKIEGERVGTSFHYRVGKCKECREGNDEVILVKEDQL